MDPIRVLHLVDPGSPGAGACTLRLIAGAVERITSIRQSVLVIGNGGHLRLAERCGLTPIGRVPAVAGRTTSARSAVLRAIESLEREHGRFQVIHAWSASACTLASLVSGDHHRVGTLAVGPLDGLETEAFGTMMAQHPMPLLTLGATVRHEYIVAGLEPAHLFNLPPGIQFDVLPEDMDEERARLRKRWNLQPGQCAIGLLGEPVRWLDAKAAVAALSLVALSGHDMVLLMHPAAQRRAAAERYAESLGIGHRELLEEELAEPWTVAAGLDVALLLSDETTVDRPRPLGSPLGVLLGGNRPLRPMTGTQSLLWCAAAGVPVIAEDTLAARAFIEEGITGFLVGRRDVYQAANRVIRLMEDEQLRGRVGAAAAAHVRRNADISAFCVRLKTVYERLVQERPMLILGDETRTVVEVERRTIDFARG